jgi:hypothetical protein
MPKAQAMTQVSRRYLIVLVVLVLFAAVWYAALRPHSSSSSGSGSSTPAPATQSSRPQPGSPTGVYHGKAPGVEGLTRAIGKAHEAVAQSEKNANQLQQKSAGASASGTAGASSATSGTTSGATKSVAPAARAGGATHPRSSAKAPASRHAKSPASPSTPLRTPARQLLVERAIKEGKIAVVLFWSPHGGDDQAVREQLQILQEAHHEARPAAAHSAAVRRLLKAIGLELQKPIAVFQARANQVTSFGSFTRAVQIYETPTILIINRQGKVKTLAGLSDAYSIEQAVDEARNS